MSAVQVITCFTLGFVTPFAALGVFTFMVMFEDFWSKR